MSSAAQPGFLVPDFFKEPLHLRRPRVRDPGQAFVGAAWGCIVISQKFWMKIYRSDQISRWTCLHVYKYMKTLWTPVSSHRSPTGSWLNSSLSVLFLQSTAFRPRTSARSSQGLARHCSYIFMRFLPKSLV